MKKWLFILLVTLLLTGCYDYQELNHRAIISGVAIDMEEDELKVSLEILNTKKSDSDKSSSAKTYYVDGSGKTLSEAFNDCNLKISKEPYYAHLKILILSEEVAKDHLKDVLDYMIREPNIRNMFIPVIAENTEASILLNSSSEENPVVSEAIQSMLETNKINESIAFKYDFETFIDRVVDSRKDAYLNVIKKEENTLKLSGIAAFQGYEFKFILNEYEAATLNILNNTSNKHLLSVDCEDDKQTNISMHYNIGTFTEVSNNKINIQSNISGTIVEDQCNYNFRDPNAYKDLEGKLEKKIEEEYQKIINLMKKNKTDLLGLQEKYYKKERKDLTNWYTLDVEYDIKVNLNKNGLIFKVENYEQS